MSFDFSVVFKGVDSNLTSTLKKLDNELKEARKKIIKTKKSFNTMLKGPVMSGGLNTIKNNVGSTFSNITDEITKKTESLSDKISNSMLPLTAMTASLGASLVFPIKKASEYEDAMLEVRRALDMTDQEAVDLRSSLESMKGGSFKELTTIAADVAKAGVSNIQDVIGITDVLNKSSKALGMDVIQSQIAVSKILNLNDIEMTGETVLSLSDKLANLENKMKTVDATQLADVWKRTSKAMGLLKIDLDEQGAIASTLLSRGISPELAASEFNIFYNRLAQVKDKMGIDVRGMITKDGIKGFKEAIQMLSALKPDELIDVLGAEGKKIVETLGTEEALKTLDDAFKYSKESAGTVMKEWDAYAGTFTAQLGNFNKSISNILALFGTPLIQAFGPMLESLGELINKVVVFLKEYPMITKVLSYSLVAFTALSAILLSTAIGIKTFRFATSFLSQDLIRNNIVTKTAGVVMIGLRKALYLTRISFVLTRARVFLLSMGLSKLSLGMKMIPFGATKKALLGLGGSFLKFFSLIITNPFRAFRMALLGASFAMSSLKAASIGFMGILSKLFLAIKTNAIGTLRAGLQKLGATFLTLGKILLTNPFVLLISSITLLITGIGYVIYNWETMSKKLLSLYNSYIAPVISGIRYGFSTAFQWVINKMNSFRLTFRGMVETLAGNVVGQKIFGTFGFDVNEYKKQTEELRKEYKKTEEDFKKKSFKVDAKIDEKDFEKSTLYKGAEALSKGMKGIFSKTKDTSEGLMKGVKDLFKEPEEQTITKSLEKQGKENEVLLKTIKQETAPVETKTKVELDVNLKKGLEGSIKTRQKRGSLKTRMREVEIG